MSEQILIYGPFTDVQQVISVCGWFCRVGLGPELWMNRVEKGEGERRYRSEYRSVRKRQEKVTVS